jgi:glucose-1-phosphate adenylyltransferase
MFNAMGIIAYNDSSVYVRGLEKYRPIAAFSFVGRYRLVDFPISNMTNSGMDSIDVYVNGNPKVLFDHIGSGRHYNINNKHGHVGLIPVYTDGQRAEYIPDVELYAENMFNIQQDPNDYVIIAPVNLIYKANYSDLLDQHVASGAAVTCLYKTINNAKEEFINCDVLNINSQHGLSSISKNLGDKKTQHVSLATYIMSKEIFINLVNQARKTSAMYWFSDILNDVAKSMDIRCVALHEEIFPIYDLKSYYASNMKMLSEENMKIFNDPDWPIYTRTNDSAPSIYLEGGTSNRSLISNGCQIAGDVKNSIVGRGVKIGKGSIVENCLILPDVEIGENTMITNVIVDKGARIIHKKEFAGYENDPLYIERRETV